MEEIITRIISREIGKTLGYLDNYPLSHETRDDIKRITKQNFWNIKNNLLLEINNQKI